MARATTRTFTATTNSRISAPREQGFSLVEVLIVIGLMALISTVLVPSLTGAFRTSAESFARQTALLLGQARDRALLTDKLIRLRIDLDKQTFVLEEAPSSYLLPKPPEHGLSVREQEELNKQEKETYAVVSDLTKEPRPVPHGLKIIQVVTPRQKKPVTEGTVDIYFFNNGNADGATIYFESDEKVHQALTIHPVTGQCRVEAKGPEGTS
jgi:type II secretion system protein H